MCPSAGYRFSLMIGAALIGAVPDATYQEYSVLPPEPPPNPHAPRASRPSGKVRDTAPKPKPRRKERRSPRHTQRRRG